MKGKIKKFLINSQSLLATLVLIFITISVISVVYVRLYKITETNCWEDLTRSAETLNDEFSRNLQYQTLYLYEYSEIIKKNNMTTKEQFHDFMKRYAFSSDIYGIYILLPDSTIISSDGAEISAAHLNLFEKEVHQGEHFSGIERNLFNHDNKIIRHYYPVQIDGKFVAILYCVIDLDFLSSEGICEIYNGEADYLIINPKTKDIYINSYTKRTGSLYRYIKYIPDETGKDYSLMRRIEDREIAMMFFNSALDGEKMFIYSTPTINENFSVCIFTSTKIVFKSVYSFKRLSFIVISFLVVCYLFYLYLTFRFTKERIEQSILQERVKKAENAAKAKTIFLSNMSHDIRTPMNAVIGYINLAVINLENKLKVKQYLSKSLVACDHLLCLINEILDMSRIENGKIKITESENNLFEIIESIENLINVQLRSRNQDFIIDKANLKDAYVMCDKLHLSQILINLLSNAVKFTHDGGLICFTINQNEYDDPEKHGFAEYEFIIKDNGIGMSSEFLKHVFEPFERDENVAGRIQGTGLGLSISKRLVEFMKGTIGINSEQNEGTEITIKLCLKKIAKDKYDAIQGKKNAGIENVYEKSDVDFSKFKQKTLLLVDDNDFNREIAVELLQRGEFNVEEASNGQEAVEKVANSTPGHYAAVLMDIQMPIMNGYEATKMIRALLNKDLANIPIIALSANAFEEDIEKAKLEKMNDYIVKPIDMQKLFEILSKLI